MTCGELTEFAYTYFLATVLPAVVSGVLADRILKTSYSDIWRNVSTSQNQSNKEFFLAIWNHFLFFVRFEYLAQRNAWLNVWCSIYLVSFALFIYGWIHLLVVCVE